MVELTAFGYRAGRTFLHQIDTRFKLLILVIVSLACIHADIPLLTLWSILLTALLGVLGISLFSILHQIRYFLFFLLLVLIVRSLTTPGTGILSYANYQITLEGLREGSVICWRMLLIVLLGHVVAASTRSAQMKAAVAWYLQPLPWVPAQKIAVMIGLVLRFIPMVFGQVQATSQALHARCIGYRKNPIYRTKMLAVPLLKRMFAGADQLAMAMEARCYSDKRTEPEFQTSCKDWICLGVVSALSATGIIF